LLLNSEAVGEQETPSPDGKPIVLPETVIIGKQTDEYTGHLPRDLITRPDTELLGLETATSVVGRREIEQIRAYSVVDGMAYIPGAWTESRGRKVKTFFSVRGQRYPYPAYTIDGAWFREFHETNYFLSAANVERIEIVRSSNAMLLGPGGMTGIVNIIPRSYESRETQVDSLFGSNCTVRAQLNHGDAKDHYAYAVGVGHRHTDGHWPNSTENISNLYGRFTYKPSSVLAMTLNSYAVLGSRELRLAEPPASKNLQGREDRFDPMSTYIFVGNVTYAKDTAASTDLTLSYASREKKGHRTGADDWWEKDHEYGINLTQVVRLPNHTVLRAGGMYNYWKSPTGKRFYVGRPGEMWTYSAVIVAEHDFGKLGLNGGYRTSRTYYEQFGGFNVEGSAGKLRSVEVRDQWEDPLHTVAFGMAYELSEGLALMGSGTWGQIAASPGMLDGDLSMPGTETRTKYDLGIRKADQRFGEIALTGFYVRQDNAAVVSNTVVIVNGEDFALHENADLDSSGLELEVKSRVFDTGFQFFVNATAMRTRRLHMGSWERDKEVPEFVLGGGASYFFHDFELNLHAAYLSSYENERFLPSGSQPNKLGDFTRLSVQLTRHFGAGKKGEVFLKIDNLADEAYSTVNGYPDAGRRYTVGCSYRF